MADCIFCKIVEGEIPSYRVYEDETAIAFMDLSQPEGGAGHVLVVPRKHVEHIYEADSFLVGHLFNLARKLCVAVKAVFAADGVLVWQSNEPAACQVVPHLHIHVFPRFDGDNWDLFGGKLPGEVSTEVLAKAREDIAAHLA